MSETILELARRAGLMSEWTDYRGEHRRVPEATLTRLLHALGLPCDTPAAARESLGALEVEEAAPAPLVTATVGQPVHLPGENRAGHLLLESGEALGLEPLGGAPGTYEPVMRPGYHRLEIGSRQVRLAVAPVRAFGVSDAAPGRRLWGLGAQMYSLRRRGDGGIGDFTALSRLAEAAAAQGADALATSPVHALFAADPERFSPYSPSSRLFLNVLHADACGAASAEDRDAAGDQVRDELARREDDALLSWPEATRARLALLRAIHARRSREPDFAAQLAEFRARAGEALRDHALFEAIHARHRRSWHDWPQALRDPRGRAAAEFEREHAAEVSFHVFLQWLAARGLAAAQGAARGAGMAIGLIGDLAVGTDGGGSHAWSRQDDMLAGASVGAPPDLINPLGQDWGLTAFSPRALRRGGYTAFIELLRAALRHVGGLRIDHVMGLLRLWLIPAGGRATEGAYLRYPFDDLLRLIVLESWRHRAVIVGEDLGTVPEGFRDRLRGAGLMGMRVLWFERHHGLFVHPARWDLHAVATTSTHDLPTVAGWWNGRDLHWRSQLGQLPPDSDEARERAARADQRRALWDAFTHAGAAEGRQPEDPAPVLDAAVRFVARSPAELAVIPIEDLAGLEEQANVPGSIDEHPNWRRRLPAPVEDVLGREDVARRLAALREERPRR